MFQAEFSTWPHQKPRHQLRRRGWRGTDWARAASPPSRGWQADALEGEKNLRRRFVSSNFFLVQYTKMHKNGTLSRQSSILVTTTLQYFWFPIDRIGLLSGRIILLVNLKESIVIHVDNPLDNWASPWWSCQPRKWSASSRTGRTSSGRSRPPSREIQAAPLPKRNRRWTISQLKDKTRGFLPHRNEICTWNRWKL